AALAGVWPTRRYLCRSAKRGATLWSGGGRRQYHGDGWSLGDRCGGAGALPTWRAGDTRWRPAGRPAAGDGFTGSGGGGVAGGARSKAGGGRGTVLATTSAGRTGNANAARRGWPSAGVGQAGDGDARYQRWAGRR